MGDAVAAVQPKVEADAVRVRTVPAEDEPPEPVALSERSSWGRKLAEGRFVSSAELIPPHGWRTGPLLEAARRFRDAGVDAVNVVDGPRAQSRMGAIPAALLVQAREEVETIVHYTCRDRHMLGMISDLLGAAAGGLRNVLIVTGDPPAMGPYRDATAVFDIDSIGLTNVVKRLNQGIDPGGNAIGAPTEFVIGVAANQSAGDGEREIQRLYWKVDAGAEFCVTQPVFDIDYPARLVPSTTPGHWHLYLDRDVPWDKYEKVLEAMADAGLIEEGFVAAAKKGKGTFVRPPHVKKGQYAEKGQQA
jgi:homocysteine S-methyltransferase